MKAPVSAQPRSQRQGGVDVSASDAIPRRQGLQIDGRALRILNAVSVDPDELVALQVPVQRHDANAPINNAAIVRNTDGKKSTSKIDALLISNRIEKPEAGAVFQFDFSCRHRTGREQRLAGYDGRPIGHATARMSQLMRRARPGPRAPSARGYRDPASRKPGRTCNTIASWFFCQAKAYRER
jgi:hypothetical protein